MFAEWIKSFGASITVMDKGGIILDMNESAGKVFEKYGGCDLIGSNLMNCHQKSSRVVMRDLMENDDSNAYTIERNGQKKIIYQAPWYKDGQVAGLVEISIPLPKDMPHFDRG